MKARYGFKVRSYECGPDGMATMPSVCNYLQEAASLHAEELGFSKSDFDAAGGNISWVLARMRVDMKRYPRWEEEVCVETWPRGGRKIVAFRDFVLRDSSGAEIGFATSEWMIIDLSTRKVVAIPQRVVSLVGDNPESVLGPDPFTARLRFPAQSAEAPGAENGELAFLAQNSHIDLNGHVNNVHYIEWLLEPFAGRQPSGMEVVFRNEALRGDRIFAESSAGADPAAGEGCRYARVHAADGKDFALAKFDFGDFVSGEARL